MLGQCIFALFTGRITRDRFEFERTRVSTHGNPVFEMGEFAGELPRKFISFHCLENESNEVKERNTERTENFPDLPQRSESEITIIDETETSPTKSLAVLQVAGAKEPTVRGDEDKNKKRVIIGSHECLMLTSDDGSEGFERFLRDKLDSLSGEGLEGIVEVDPTAVLEFLKENLVDRGSVGSNVVPVDIERPKNSVVDMLRAELNEKWLGSVSKRSLCDVDADVAGERPLKECCLSN